MKSLFFLVVFFVMALRASACDYVAAQVVYAQPVVAAQVVYAQPVVVQQAVVQKQVVVQQQAVVAKQRLAVSAPVSAGGNNIVIQNSRRVRVR